MTATIFNINSAAKPEMAQPPSPSTSGDGRFTSSHRPPSRFWDATPCEGPNCQNVIPAGLYAPQRLRSFCSKSCRFRESGNRYVVGSCHYCGGPVIGRKDNKRGKKYCSNEHRLSHATEQIMCPTGVFRPLLEDYMETTAANYYATGTLATVRVSLSKFFRFVAQVEKISKLEDIRPAVVSRFIALEHGRGMTSRNSVGHIATFFNAMIAEEKYIRVNPVVSRIHSQRGAPAEARPYTERDLQAIWESVVRTGRVELMLAFAIGEECGLRIGEVCNIRLSDVDASAQTIFIRLPTKNRRPRKVPFHGKVAQYLAQWLEQRDPKCADDHLLHNKAFRRYDTIKFDAWFKKNLKNEPAPADAFAFHRLRHTWASRLMNNGMDLATLKELGGWKFWNSMQKYVKVLDSTVRTQYEAAFARLEEKAESDQDEVISLIDFALIDEAAPPSAPVPTT